MKKFTKFSILYLVLTFIFCWGIAVGKYNIFPYKFINSLAKEFVKIYKNDTTINEITITDRIKNDLGFFPSKHLVEFYSDAQNYKKIDLEFDSRRSSTPIIKSFLNDSEKNILGDGYLLVQGFMDFKKSLYGSILINIDGKIVNKWVYDSFELGNKKEALKNNYNAHPVTILSDGSLVYTINDTRYGIRMVRKSYCGKVIWTKLGRYHHSLSLDQDENLWTSNGEDSFVLLDKNNGNIIKEILLKDVFRKNRNLGLFNFHINLPENNIIIDDPFHLNDVDPLNFNLKSFKKGDLLISFRNSNLIFVLDQVTLKIKWWAVGHTIRQHDPDWHNGYITVFDNSMRNNKLLSEKKYMSRIVKINLDDIKSETLYDGVNHGAYSVIRGNHQLLNNGFILATISSQGRVLILDKDNQLKIEFINKYNKVFNGLITESIWLSKENFNIDEFKCN